MTTTCQTLTIKVRKSLLAFRFGTVLKPVIMVVIFFNCFTAAAQEMLWGVASKGGAWGVGAIFMTNADGTDLAVKKSFEATSGRSPSYTKLIQAANGKIYGMTGQGGAYLKGVLFEYNPSDDSYVKKHDFNDIDGAHPYGGLVQVNNKLYGLTSVGGINEKGVLFEYDLATSTYEKKIDFGGQLGEEPSSDLVVTSDGNLYGVTHKGGTHGFGVIFKYNPQKNTFTKRRDFDGLAGGRPLGGLLVASSGVLYGMTSEGGLNSLGTIYAYDTAANVITKKFDFSGSADGARPLGRLIEATNGLLYGMTLLGGSIDRGVLFEYNPASGTVTKKVDFDGGTKGIYPYGSLFQAANGKLYGTTEQGIASFGGLFEYDISSGNFSTVITFDGSVYGKGGTSRTTLMQASDGKLYGMTGSGGLGLQGVLFSYNPADGGYQVRVNFEFDKGAGLWPIGGVVQGANGKIYGTTYIGGENRCGTLFEYDITHEAYTKRFDFNETDGANSLSKMVLAANDKLYGVTRFGGRNGAGVIFEYDPAINRYAKKIDFQAGDGNPVGALIQIPSGKMYGVASILGSFVQAMLFEYDPAANTFIKKIDFDGTINGNTPAGTLLYSDDKIYGLMRFGGAYNMGTLFEFDPATGILIKLKDFNGTSNGAEPVGSLIKAKNNKLYGVTQRGGVFNSGAIIEYDPATGNLNKKFDFPTLWDNHSGLIESSNGKLYGTTFQGGSENFGMLYEFDVTSNTYTKKQDFVGINGAYVEEPLLFVSMDEQAISSASLEEKTYGDNQFALTATASSGLPVTYTSTNPTVASINGNIVTIHAAGTTTITAFQTGSPNFHPTASSQLLTVNRANQTITFNAIAEKKSIDDPFNLSASASSGLPITYTSDDPSVATISGSILTIHGDGTALITATQSGNDNYNPAENVSQPLTVIFVLSADSPYNSLLKLYPNPAKHEFFIESVSTRLLNANSLQVYDYLGRPSTIPLEKEEDGRYRCTTSHLAAGLHFVVIPGYRQPKVVMIVR